MEPLSSTSVSSTRELLKRSILISQGAEAAIYKAYLENPSSRDGFGVFAKTNERECDDSVLLKYRFQKQYRHPSLDGSLTRARIAGEARALMRCLRSGVKVPGIRMVDAAEGVLGIEWIDGMSVRKLLPGGSEPEDDEVNEGDEFDSSNDDQEDVGTEDPLAAYGVSRDHLMDLIGTEIAKMHLADIIHGDLTTSNMMLRRNTNDLLLIDFGLSYHSSLVEDKAVDLYVLERAFSSTHPESEPLFASVLSAYEKRVGKQWISLKKRLDDVRLRGRKRSMVG
ncbi:hypothetical protein BJ138DRAFT_1090573 [Hygrophoropsis aurantiaca]|uniref:Uncharacterized protein n=1 Tax=Hygrophoropsis aurantiaca TaxID=72124 RepID=A0ACB8A5S8_9AGAM|nr:hypothetical protein BJ138DRAFT_1090573 [Hygrophoropsis aurantiaca]